ncbi:uncharacterized protein [Maniola hyperantus]|uniref:uncharacterized protein isoform X2 n=1 Tax=Aphantopus hyperantus TaxID=2795564 RepID=UPI0021444BC0
MWTEIFTAKNKNMTEEAYINKLPFELFEIILRKINGSVLGKCRRVCKGWKELIDSSEYLWHEKCRKEFKNSSKIAKRKSGNQCTWYHIYRNLYQWSDLKEYDIEIREFYKFSLSDISHVLNIDYGILPLRDDKGTFLYDTSTLKYITVALPERNCLKIMNNDYVTIMQVKSGIYIQRTVDSDTPEFLTEAYLKTDDFILANTILYLHHNRNIFSLDLTLQEFTPEFIVTIDYSIKEMQYNEGVLYLFTDYGYIATLDTSSHCFKVKYRPINCPVEWIKQIKHIRAVDDKNFVCYSRNLIKIEVDQYKHLYLEFPPITALFFYVDIILFATGDGKILLYRLSSQETSFKPTFETLARLPEGKVAVQLDVCERRSGPLIVASTFFELYVIEIPFFPYEKQTTKSTFTADKLHMYKRMQKLKERLKSNNNRD